MKYQNDISVDLPKNGAQPRSVRRWRTERNFKDIASSLKYAAGDAFISAQNDSFFIRAGTDQQPRCGISFK